MSTLRLSLLVKEQEIDRQEDVCNVKVKNAFEGCDVTSERFVANYQISRCSFQNLPLA